MQILLTTADQLSGYISNNTNWTWFIKFVCSCTASQGISTTSLGSSQYLYDNSELYIPTEYQNLFATANLRFC